MIIAVIILSLALIASMTLLFLLKKDIRLMSKDLGFINQNDTNMRLTTITFDKDVCILVSRMNKIITMQNKILLSNEKSNRELRQTITNISHDLRTPLTSAIGYIQLIQSDKTPTDKKVEYQQIVEARLKALSGLMNEFFEYSQIVEGKTAFSIEKVNVCNVLRDVISAFYTELMDKEFKVKILIPETPVYVFCDLIAFKRVALNLVQNTLIHGVEVFELIVDPAHQSIQFRNKVSDIGALDVTKMFDRFYSADISRSRKTTGLGLAIVKELVTHMGGEISAQIEGDLLIIEIKTIEANGDRKEEVYE